MKEQKILFLCMNRSFYIYWMFGVLRSSSFSSFITFSLSFLFFSIFAAFFQIIRIALRNFLQSFWLKLSKRYLVWNHFSKTTAYGDEWSDEWDSQTPARQRKQHQQQHQMQTSTNNESIATDEKIFNWYQFRDLLTCTQSPFVIQTKRCSFENSMSCSLFLSPLICFY